MDLNYLYHRQQVEHMRADAAGSAPARDAHRALAEGYEAEIERQKDLRTGELAHSE